MSNNWRSVYLSDTGATGTGTADKSITVPEDREYRIQSLIAQFTTTASAGTHQLYLTMDRGQTGDTGPYVDARAGATQAQSLTYFYEFGPDLPLSTAAGDTDYLTVPIPDVVLPAGWVIRVFDQSAVGSSDDALELRALVSMRGAKSST